MNENFRKVINQPSVLEMVSKIQNQNKLTNPTIEISEKLADAMQQMNPVSHLASSAVNQDLLSQLSQTFPPNNIILDNATEKMMKILTESAFLNTSVFESLRLNTSFIDSIEAVNLSLKPQIQFVFPKGITSGSQVGDLSSIISKATETFKKYDQFSELESFKAISRLKNFPFEDVVRNNFDYFTELKESSDETILELDLEISERLSLIDDFNDLSLEDQSFILSSYRICYYPIILNCLIILLWLKDFLDEKLDLTNNTFNFVERSKVKLSYISNVYRLNPSAIMDNVVAGGALMLLAKILRW